ncbi:nickel-dependent hydrogenase large subunit [Candidatus Bipolaricaulota sp. J31]
MQTFEINLLRVAGELRVEVKSAPDGTIAEVRLAPYAPVRGFQTLIKGRSVDFVVPAVMRICGVCHTVQGAAVCEAIEGALGIRPPREGLLLREAAVLANRLQSHFFQHFLVIPDLVPPGEADGLRGEALRGVDLASSLLQIIAGTATHPIRVVAGGMAQGPTDKALEKARDVTSELAELARTFAGRFSETAAEGPLGRELAGIDFPVPFFASDPFYGDSAMVNPDLVETGEASGNALLARYGGREVEAGPRARMTKFSGFTDTSLLGIQLARTRELALTVDRVREILEEVAPGEPVRLAELPLRAGVGLGVVEAPRGTLIHRVELDAEGRIVSLDIVTPTQFNFALLRGRLVGLPAHLAEVVVRMYDPCIPCVIH